MPSNQTRSLSVYRSLRPTFTQDMPNGSYLKFNITTWAKVTVPDLKSLWPAIFFLIGSHSCFKPHSHWKTCTWNLREITDSWILIKLFLIWFCFQSPYQEFNLHTLCESRIICSLVSVDISKNCWMSCKQYRYWSDILFCSVWTGFKLII